MDLNSNVISVNKIYKKYRLGFIRRDDTLRDKISAKTRKILSKRRNREFTKKQKPRDFWALEDVSFDVQKGETLGVIGPNGAGKSTILKLLSQITYPTKGEIVIRGRLSSLLEVGTGFHPELSGRENIFMNGSILGMTRNEIKYKFDEIVDFSGIEKFIDTPVKRYSSGMYVRLAFSVAAHLEPEILLVDEVLAVGDIEFRKKCLGKMKDVSKSGRTVVFVSHNMGAIRDLVKRCMLIDEGKILYDGNPELCIKKYLNLKIQDEEMSKISFNDRIPSEENPLLIKEIRLISKDGNETNTFNLGDPWNIEICFTALENNIKFQVDIEIINEQGVNVQHLVMTDSGVHSIKTKKPLTYLRVSIEKIRLVPGKYYVSIWSGSAGLGRRDYDYLQSVISFNVEQDSIIARSSFIDNPDVVICNLSKLKAIFFDIGKWEVL